jgi:KaiC/GvpD/RAD55 family RecA-like ATPase
VNFIIRAFDELVDIVYPRYLLRPLIETGSVGMVFGPSGIGKSFVTIDLAMSIAGGLPWGTLHASQMPVFYIAAEGGDAFGRRVRAWYLDAIATRVDTDEERRALRAALESNFFVIPQVVQLAERGHRESLIQDIRELCPDRQIGMVIVDTVARNALGIEENNNTEMGQFVDACYELRTGLGLPVDEEDDSKDRREPVVLLVHHTGTVARDADGNMRARGASALRSGVDFSFALDGGPPLRLVADKLKDAEAPLPMAVTFSEPIIVGYDREAGEHITTIASRVGPPGSATSPKEDKAEKRNRDNAALDREIMGEMERAPDLSIREIAKNLDVSKSTIDRRVRWLKDSGQIIRKDRKYVTSNVEHVPVKLLS